MKKPSNFPIAVTDEVYVTRHPRRPRYLFLEVYEKIVLLSPSDVRKLIDTLLQMEKEGLS